MLTESEARQEVLKRVGVCDGAKPEPTSLDAALDRLAAERILASVALPGFDNSQMDGYAVKASEAQSGSELQVSGEQAAGPDRGLNLESGQAIRIFTGAPMPQGADAVIMQEDVEVLSNGSIRIHESVEPGEFIRRKGADLCPSQVVLEIGQKLTPAKLGVLASQGLGNVLTKSLPRCAVVTTGDELVNPEQELTSGAIYNSNGPMLRALVKQFGGQPIPFHAPDDPKRLRAVLEQALAESDFCFVAGGVSVGDHDHVKGELEALGVEGGFWRVRMKPGKPLFFGQRNQQFVFGLPGNPVSAYLTFLLFGVSALQKWQGLDVQANEPALPSSAAKLTAVVQNDRGNRPHYVRGRLDLETREFHPVGLQQSYALFALSQTDALVRVEPEQTLEAGTTVKCYRMVS